MKGEIGGIFCDECKGKSKNIVEGGLFRVAMCGFGVGGNDE